MQCYNVLNLIAVLWLVLGFELRVLHLLIRTQGLALANKVLFHLSHAPTLFALVIFQ
jgi:hypothetical protein